MQKLKTASKAEPVLYSQAFESASQTFIFELRSGEARGACLSIPQFPKGSQRGLELRSICVPLEGLESFQAAVTKAKQFFHQQQALVTAPPKRARERKPKPFRPFATPRTSSITFTEPTGAALNERFAI